MSVIQAQVRNAQLSIDAGRRREQGPWSDGTGDRTDAQSPESNQRVPVGKDFRCDQTSCLNNGEVPMAKDVKGKAFTG